MSWINSNATNKQNSKNDLSFYHGFSKTPVEPNTSTGNAVTTLGNASTKGGHTVIGTEVWAEEIPWFGLVPSRAVAVTRLSGLTKLNDLVKVDGEGGKVYKYIGADDATFTEAQWSSFWQEVTLTNGMTLNNRHNQPVLRYYLNQPMQTLTTTNNASIDSKGYATRLFVNESNHTGQTSGGSVVSQFAAGTDNIKNGIPSVELNPKLYYNTTEKIAGTHYYDYNVSGTVLWNENVTSKGVKISCFRYIGKTVTGQLSTVDSTVKSHALDIADIKLALGMNPNPDSPTTSVTARVETVEDVVRVLLGLGDSDAIAATESIATTANTAATTAISGALEEGGSIAQKIAAAVSAAEGRIKVTTDALQGAIDTLNGSETTTGSVAKAVADAEGRVKVTTDALAGRIAQLEGIAHFSVEVVDALPTAPVENTIYLVAEDSVAEGTYIEYIAYKPAGSETVVTEKIGSTAIDLSGYTTDAEHTALAGRVTTVEGKVTTLEGQVATLNGTETTAGSVAKALADAKTYADGKASAAQAAAESTASAALTSALEQVAEDIEAAKNAAIASAEVTITAGTGIVVTPEGKGTTFEIAVSDDVATAASVTALSEVVASNKTELDGKIEGVSGRVTTLEGQVSALTTGENSVDTKIATAVETLEGEISGAVESLEGQITETQTTLSGEIDGVAGRVTTLENVTVPAAAAAAEAAQTTANQAVSDAAAVSTALDTAKSQTLAQTGTLSGMFSVTTAGTVGTGITGITISDTGLGAAITKAKTDAEATAATALSTARGEITTEIGTAVSGLETKLTSGEGSLGGKVTALEGSVKTINETTIPNAITTAQNGAVTTVKALTLSATDSDDAAKVTVTLSGTVETPSITVTTSDIASAATLSDLVSTVNTHIAEAAGLYLSVEKVDTLPADDKAEKNKIYLVPVDTEAGREQNIHTEYIWTNNKWEIIGTTAIDINSLEAAAKAAKDAADAANTTIAAMDATKTVNGLTVTQVDGKITGLSEALITASVPAGTTSVEGNVAYVGSTKHVIAPEKFQTAVQMPNTLTSWVADLSNLTDGTAMFKGCTGLTTFIGDLSSLTNGTEMFSGCTLDAESLEILSDNLPTVTSGTIEIGAQTNATDEVISTIKAKGWTVTSNGAAL